MFEHLTEVRQPAITRKSVARVLGAVFLLGLALGARLTSLAYHDHWNTWNPFNEVIFWAWVIPACGAVWRYIPAILERLPLQDSTDKDVS
jgi:hypothetical protein